VGDATGSVLTLVLSLLLGIVLLVPERRIPDMEVAA